MTRLWGAAMKLADLIAELRQDPAFEQEYRRIDVHDVFLPDAYDYAIASLLALYALGATLAVIGLWYWGWRRGR